jgi:hypothetical protein
MPAFLRGRRLCRSHRLVHDAPSGDAWWGMSRHPLYTVRMAEKRSVSEAFEQAAHELEAEVKRAVEYIETNVPKARRDGEKMLRRLSEELNRWADRLHDEEQKK